MDFATKINGGHFGPRKFWREYLPRLKFHNPAVSMSVNRSTDQDGPATMTIFLSEPTVQRKESSSDAHRAPVLGERVEVIDMKNKRDSEIFGEFLNITGAVEVSASADEVQQLRDLEEQRERSRQDREESQRLMIARQQEQSLLDQARRAVA